MTHTVQPLPETVSGEICKIKDNMNILLSVCDSLNNLSKALNRMDNIQNKLCEKLTRLENIVHNI